MVAAFCGDLPTYPEPPGTGICAYLPTYAGHNLSPVPDVTCRHALHRRGVRRCGAAVPGQSPADTSNLMYRDVSIHQARDVSPAVSYTGPVSNLVSLILEYIKKREG